jgi:SAM-dependent methyltransferase
MSGSNESGGSVHLHEIRRAELAAIAPFLPAGKLQVLEIGGGDGFQAAELARRYGWVAAVDLPDPGRLGRPLYPVVRFDGLRLPFADASFDLVFSSHVLEHVTDVAGLQAEIRRVMRPGARAIHVLPSATWRVWTLLTHYATLPRRILRRWGRSAAAAGDRPRPRLAERLMAAAVDRRHGARGHVLSEVWLYSRYSWGGLFNATGFRIETIKPIGLYYTGYSLLGGRLGIQRRQALAKLFGSASVAYVLTVNVARPPPAKIDR